jgi:uncharacterized protein (TIGR02246 family)
VAVSDEDGKELEARVRRIEDRFAIHDLVSAYCTAIDSRDLDGFVACFTVDAVVRFQDGVLDLRGREAIRGYYERRFRDYGVTYHYAHNHTVTFEDDDHASGTVTGHAEMGLDGEGWIAALRYTDRYRREDGGWRFAERELASWYYMRLADLPQGLGSELRKHYRGRMLPAELPESLETYRAWHE